ncbi:GNAT family N-acetyltransferase [Kitasatospora sp. NPDC018058]|uniref:GNAT family N-acetyltransferase n=1 Tax=Kitasatospora sp. NPDC018058 TaxID=3364025 RepID=UPI0037BFC4B9
MGKASRRRAENRSTGSEGRRARSRVRPAGPADAERVQQLMELVEWSDPSMPSRMAAALRQGYRPQTPGLYVALVAEDADGLVAGALTAGPPMDFAAGSGAVGPGYRDLVARRIVDLEAVAVDSERRGRGLGAELIDAAVNQFRHSGYRLMTGSFQASRGYLAPYYERRGFTVLEAGEPLVLAASGIGGAAWPATSDMRQMWQGIVPGVALAGRIPRQTIGGVLDQP